MNVPGIDPGLASFGYCIGSVFDGEARVCEIGVWRTAKVDRKIAIRGTSDTANRVALLYRWLTETIDRTNPGVLCMEDFSPPRSAGAATKVARVFGMLDAVAEYEGFASLRVTPREIKMATAGRNGATKKEVEDGARHVCTEEAIEAFEARVCATQRNHGWDAVGAVIACIDHPAMRMMGRGVA